ncbi:hypothetical protein NH341_06985 [Tenacibaculum sp. XPcli2-G]|uniref:hypothetical protein n=1 Tax=Tenacibaculum sp. XPcli2-G TaxID=2954503 RepID=UPI00209726BD|nr:hypothetical protein [Tenacibaculum sp. XPcli2-G]MCO7185165.1 hypothetical protein [Tenacibaculum sp. XPcli2-G]
MKKWIKEGIAWGVIMFIIMVIFFPWYDGEEITLKRMLVGALIWGAGGLFYGFLMNKLKRDS